MKKCLASKYLFTIIFIVLTYNIFPQTPNSSLGKKTLDEIVSSQSKGKIVVKSFEKTNGIMREIAGQKIYTLEYKTIIEFAKAGWKRCMLEQGLFGNFVITEEEPPQGWQIPGKEDKFFDEGDEVELTGEITYENTENGWRKVEYKWKTWKITASGSEKRKFPKVFGTYKDSRDGKIYKTVQIDEQTWMAENLNSNKFNNGDLIPEAKTAEEWQKAYMESKPAWCYYENKAESGKKFGKLYNWYAVNDQRGIAPKGWHIPTQVEFQTLATAVDNDGNALKAVGQGTGSGVGTNISDFSALLAGIRNSDGNFLGSGDKTTFWSSSENNAAFAYGGLNLWSNLSNVGTYNGTKGVGFSVRCLKD